MIIMDDCFFNFHHKDTRYIYLQCRLLCNVLLCADENDSKENRELVSKYFLHAMAGWKGSFKDHPAQLILEDCAKYLKERGYRCQITESKVFLYTPDKVRLGKEILEDTDAFPTSVILAF
jgi:hypothetical protein